MQKVYQLSTPKKCSRRFTPASSLVRTSFRGRKDNYIYFIFSSIRTHHQPAVESSYIVAAAAPANTY